MMRTVTFEKKIALSLVAVCAVALGLSGQFGFQFLRSYQLDSLRQNALRVARSAASLLDHTACERVVSAYAHRENPQLGEADRKTLQQTLRAVKESGDLRADIHFAARSPWSEQTMVVLGTSHPKSYWGNTLSISRAAEETLSRKISTTSGFYADREGDWISAYSPVVSRTGKLLGATVVHSRVDDEISAASFAFWGMFVMMGAGLLLSSYFVGLRFGRHTAKRLRHFLAEMKRVAAGEPINEIRSAFPEELAEVGRILTAMAPSRSAETQEVAQLREQWLFAEAKGDLSRRLLRDLLEKTERAVWLVTGNEGLIVAVSDKATRLLGTNPTGRTLAEVGGFSPMVFSPVLAEYFGGPANQLTTLARLPHRFHRENKSVSLSFEPLVGVNGRATALLAELEPVAAMKVPPPLPTARQARLNETGAGIHWRESLRAKELKNLLVKNHDGSVSELQLQVSSLGILQSRPGVQLELFYPAASVEKCLSTLRERVEGWGGVVDCEPHAAHGAKVSVVLPLEN